MKFKILTFLGIIISLISCKNDNKNESSNSETKELIEAKVPGIKFSIDAIIKDNDTLQVYYRYDTSSDYVSEQSVNAVVKGSDSIQEVNFEIPGDKVIADFRLDIGNNVNQRPIQFKGFKMELNGKRFQTVDTMFIQYFNPNNQIEYDRKTSTATILKNITPYDPLFVPREPLLDEIKKLY